MAKRIGDLTGKRFGKLLITRLSGKDKYYDKLWECLCDCGNSTTVRQGHLLSGHTTSCGCKKPQLDDLSGQRFGHLQVQYRTRDYVGLNGKHYVQWHCLCDCGQETDVVVNNLKSGSISSCGCMRFEDLSGQQFGDLIVLERTESYVTTSNRKLVKYKCKCSCGNIKDVLATSLRNGDSTSCGCKVNSKGEHIVSKFLKDRNYSFVTHKSFDDCVSDEGYKLNFDFYVEEFNLLIECNGLQHYEPVDFFGGADRFENQKRHDTIKQNYVKNRGFNYLVLDCRKHNLKNLESCLCDFFTKLS